MLEAEPGGGKHLLGPAAVRDVEPEGPRRVRHLGHMLAAQPVAEPVLGKQHLRDPGEHLGLVGGDPQQLRGGEARHRAVAGDPARLRHPGFEGGALGAGAPVVPEDRGPEHLAARVEEGRSVHLPREPDGPRRGERGAVIRPEPVHGTARRGPPGLGVLLRPEGTGGGDLEGSGRLPDGAVVAVDEHRLHPRGAEIDAEIHAGPSRRFRPARPPRRRSPCRHPLRIRGRSKPRPGATLKSRCREAR